GWSGASLLTELFRCHAGLHKEGWEKRKRLSRQFRHFIEAETEVVRSEEARGFWAGQLQGFDTAMLPWGKARAAKAEMRSPALPIAVETSEALNEWARRMGVSLKTVLLAA